MKRFLPIIFVLLFTPWIDRLFAKPIAALLTVCACIFLYALVMRVPNDSKKIYTAVLTALFVVLTVFQITTTKRQFLFEISNDDNRYQQEKLDSYPPVKIPISNKTLWIPAAHWFEGRSEYLAYYRIEENLFENLDPGNYFFAMAPRPRTGVDEFEKFLYIFLPFFVYGLYKLIRNNWEVVVLTTLPFLALLSLVGNSNPLGAFTLLPIIAVAVAVGMKPLFQCKNRIYLYVLIVLTLLVYIQIIAYQSYV
ncbi:hypothetical protein ACFL2C_00770 [Patescibacteria group bacterium]